MINVRELLADAYDRRDEAKELILSPKGYNTGIGYMGFVDGLYFLFASEADYIEFINDLKEEVKDDRRIRI